MKEINRKIIAFLKQRNDWTTSKDLSNEFQLSTRTIKKYISEINDEANYLIDS
ncbi:MAG: HTH domain-containing protein, partial [Streptococcus sp.]|nr:HTH domain-containing protein [Streptococcus sp.]